MHPSQLERRLMDIDTAQVLNNLITNPSVIIAGMVCVTALIIGWWKYDT